jgi:dUTPase
MLKFPRPRTLTINEYPDLVEDEPVLMQKLITQLINPLKSTDMDEYIKSTISYIKGKSDQNTKKTRLFNTKVGKKLFYVKITFPPSEEEITCLVDTGASNSLLHHKIAERLQIEMQPTNMQMATATGTSSNIIMGTSHRTFRFTTSRNQPVEYCTNFIITRKLNGMQCILGAEFLLDENRVFAISASKLITLKHNYKHMIPIFSENPESSLNNIVTDEFLDKKEDKTEKSDKQERTCKLENICDIEESEDLEEEYVQTDMEENLSIASVYNHNISEDLEDETLPPSEQLFDTTYELKFESLEKKLTLEDADYSDCPTEYLEPLKNMLKEYEDRFSKSKLDLQKTTIYEASLPTIPGRKVQQKVRRLPQHKFDFAIQAIRQLQESGVVRESDSSWRSNVVLVPKPTGKDEDRDNSNAARLTGEQNFSPLYRICLDFRELNTCLEFPQQTSFTTIDEILYKLRNKVVVSMDISSAFFIIPIKEEDKHKTAFWVNQLAFEFNVAVMGLKSSPYHLNKFIEKAFNKETFNSLKEKLSKEEQKLAPDSFQDIFISYFDDFFVYAETYTECILALKLILQAARLANIKFSAEKTTFLTKKFKVLGYHYDTETLHLTMNKNKVSAFANMKKPSSLYELHSRLASFQYQQQFLPFIKHILYPLNFLLRKKQFTWTAVEERAWQTAIALTKLNIQLTVPESTDTLLLTTDASKVAAAAVLFKVKNDKLELVSATSKYFSTADLGKSSYFLEAIALAYGIKSFAPYLLNCQAKILIYTDAKALIYAKRMSTHSILLNNTLSYLTNFVSIANVELYHLPGAVNVLADVLSRAIADNLNHKLPKEHPISRQWAQVLPPIPPNFGVDHDTLYEFLTKPLQTEVQDVHDRTLKRLMEPKSVLQMYKESQSMTSEEKFHSAQVLLKQWFSDYAKDHNVPEAHIAAVHHSQLELEVEIQKACIDKVQEIMDKLYVDIKNTPLFRALQKNLEEVSKNYIYCLKNPLTDKLVGKLKESQQQLIETTQLIDQDNLDRNAQEAIKINFMEAIQKKEIQKEANPMVYYSLHPTATKLPKICADSNGLDIPLQETIKFEPYEIKKVNLKIKFQFPKNHCALLMNKSSARTKYNVNVQLGLIDVGYHDFVMAVIQNTLNKPVVLYAGTAVAQLLLLPAKIPEFREEWPLTHSKRGSFGSTGQTFQEKTITNYTATIKSLEALSKPENQYQERIPFEAQEEKYESCPMLDIKSRLDPDFIKICNMKIHIFSDPCEKTQIIYSLQEFENGLLDKISPYIIDKLPTYQLTVDNKESQLQAPSQETAIQETKLFPKHYSVPITPDDLSHLLAADLLVNRKLTIETLIYLQNQDPHIAYYKDKMLPKQAERKFIMKKGVVCKISKTKLGEETLVVYLPSVLLYPTVVYIHKYFLHPSRTQTLLEFQQHYYHPQAPSAISKVCRACLVCAMSKNPEYRLIPVGTERTVNPTQPRQAISMDILYMPRSSRGHTHALLIADLYSMYLSFFPLKSKSSSAIAEALRQYISLQGIPKIVYSDNDKSFRDEVETLLKSYQIQHCTSYPYCQRGNTVEAQVRKFKNAARAAILENPLTNHTEWYSLYPLVVVRLNTMVSKYGASREIIHFQDQLDSQLPLITEFKCHDELEKDLNFEANKFRSAIMKFLHNKQKRKDTYKTGVTQPFLVHELVMRKIYNPASPLHPTYAGPLRIIELYPQGALIKDTRTGEMMSVHYMNLRKITQDEFISLLPNNFDADILQNLGIYRYNRNHLPDPAEQTLDGTDEEHLSKLFSEEPISKESEDEYENSTIDTLRPPPMTMGDQNERKLRSGRIIKINTYTLPGKYRNQAGLAYWSYFRNKPEATAKPKSCLTRNIVTERTPYATLEQYFGTDCYLFYSDTQRIPRPDDYHKTKYKSSFSSSLPGYLTITLAPEKDNGKRTRFGQITVKFY